MTPDKVQQKAMEWEAIAQVAICNSMMLRGKIGGPEQYCAEVAPLIRAILEREMYIADIDWRDAREAVTIIQRPRE